MTEKQEKEYIHWQELAEQLGADTTSQIDDYFGGTASFSDIELDESELPDMLPELPDAVVAGQPTEDSAVSSAPLEADETANAVSTQESSVSNQLDNEIGWNTPQPPKTAAEKPQKKAKTKKKMNKKPAAKTQTKAQSTSSTESTDDNHWDFLASTLGLEDASAEVAASLSPASEDAIASEPEPETSKAASQPEPSPVRVAEPGGFGAGLIDFDEIKPTEEEITQENILNEMFVASSTSFEQVEITTTAVEPCGSDEESEIEPNFDDEEFVEFEVEDLDPAGRRPAGQRNPRRGREASRRNRADSHDDSGQESSDRVKKPRSKANTEESDRPRRKRKKRAESVGENQDEPRTRKRRSNHDDDDSSDDRPRKRRGSRSESTDLDEGPRKRTYERTEEDSDEDRPRKRRSRRPRSEKSHTSNHHSDVENYDGDEEDRTETKSRRGGKSDDKTRKLPTWADTIEVIVETNISSRKKPPKKKRGGGGRSRRGGGNSRDRDRN